MVKKGTSIRKIDAMADLCVDDSRLGVKPALAAQGLRFPPLSSNDHILALNEIDDGLNPLSQSTITSPVGGAAGGKMYCKLSRLSPATAACGPCHGLGYTLNLQPAQLFQTLNPKP